MVAPMLKTLFYVHRRVIDNRPLAMMYKQFWYVSETHNYDMRS